MSEPAFVDDGPVNDDAPDQDVDLEPVDPSGFVEDGDDDGEPVSEEEEANG